MITLGILIGLNSKQGDVTAIFLHANIEESENLWVNISKVFDKYSKTGHKKCLRFKKTLYVVRQIPHEFWQYLRKKLDVCDLKQL